MYGFIMTCIEL